VDIGDPIIASNGDIKHGFSNYTHSTVPSLDIPGCLINLPSNIPSLPLRCLPLLLLSVHALMKLLSNVVFTCVEKLFVVVVVIAAAFYVQF
jgi:hypothetical protein